MSVDSKDIWDGITLKPVFHESGNMSRALIAEIRDIYLRRNIALKRGLAAESSWEEINRHSAETARMLAAIRLGMDKNTPWNEIVDEDKKRTNT
jgi:hypothetical protein